MQFGLDTFHRQVRALHDTDLQHATGARVPVGGPPAQLDTRGVRVRQVRLQHDAGIDAGEVRLVEHTAHRRDRQRQVAVFLHVEVDERGRCRRRRGAVEAGEALGDPLDGVIESEHIEVGADGRDLQRHVRDIGPDDARVHLPQPSVGLGIAQDRLAQHVHVQAEPLIGAAAHVIGERRIIGRQHHAPRLRKQPASDQRHDESWHDRRHSSAERQSDAIDRCQTANASCAPHHRREPSCGAGCVVDAEHLVGEREGQFAQRCLVDHLREARLSASLGARGHVERRREQISCSRHRRLTHGL